MPFFTAKFAKNKTNQPVKGRVGGPSSRPVAYLISHLSPPTSHLSFLTSHLSPLTSHLSPMSKAFNPQVPLWTQIRVLGFLNQARQPKDISNHVLLKDDPMKHSSSGYTIGETVAQRILDRRAELPGRRFSEFKQLEGIQGLGADKLHDLLHAWRNPVAEMFRDGMYENVIRSNFVLRGHSVAFEDEATFLEVANDPFAFQAWVAMQVEALAERHTEDRRLARMAARLLWHAYLESYPSGGTGALAFALWWYRFDEDNWFSFEQVLAETRHYLDYAFGPHDRRELRLFKGFENAGVLVDAICPADLPVVIHYAEQSITVWTCQLND